MWAAVDSFLHIAALSDCICTVFSVLIWKGAYLHLHRSQYAQLSLISRLKKPVCFNVYPVLKCINSLQWTTGSVVYISTVTTSILVCEPTLMHWPCTYSYMIMSLLFPQRKISFNCFWNIRVTGQNDWFNQIFFSLKNKPLTVFLVL